MNVELEDELIAIRESFQNLFAKEAGAEFIRHTEPQCFSKPLWDHLVHMDALGIGVAEERGGAGGGIVELAIIAEEQGRALAPVPFIDAVVLTRALARCGADDLLRDIVDGSIVPALASPLVDHSLAGGVGAVRAVPYGAVADVLAVTDHDELVVVDRKNLRVEPCGKSLGAFPLADWHVDGSHRWRASGGTARGAIDALRDEWRILTSALLVGMADAAVQLAVEYARLRIQFGKPIGQYQAIAHRLATCATRRDGARLLVAEAARCADDVGVRRREMAAMALAFTSETAEDVASASLHTHGGYGFMLEYDVQLYLRRIKATVLGGGASSREFQHVADALRSPAVRS